MSASPRARIASAISGALMRFEAITGIFTASLMRRVAHAKPAARHRLRDGRDARLVPADAGVEDVAPAASIARATCSDFRRGQAAFHELERRDAVDDDEIRARGGAHRRTTSTGKAHAVLEAPAPVVLALVGARREKLA